MTLARVPKGLELQTENSGAPVELLWAPEIPLGAHLSGAELDGKPVDARSEEHAQDTHAALTFTVPHGKSHCLIRYEGGVLLSVSDAAPLLGEPSKQIKITSVAYKPASLVIDADVSPDAPHSTIELRTDEKVLKARGAKLKLVSDGVYDLLVDPVSNPVPPDNTGTPRSLSISLPGSCLRNWSPGPANDRRPPAVISGRPDKVDPEWLPAQKWSEPGR